MAFELLFDWRMERGRGRLKMMKMHGGGCQGNNRVQIASGRLKLCRQCLHNWCFTAKRGEGALECGELKRCHFFEK